MQIVDEKRTLLLTLTAEKYLEIYCLRNLAKSALNLPAYASYNCNDCEFSSLQYDKP